MAQLKSTTIDGDLKVSGNIVLNTINNGVQCNGNKMIQMSADGHTLIGYDGYVDKIGNTHICGKDIKHFVSSVDTNYIPYYKAGDTIDFHIKTSGFITASGRAVAFTIPITKPVIGSPSAVVTVDNGFILRQDGNYTHGSNGSPETYVKATSFSIENNYNCGFVVTATFDVNTGSVVNNSHIGIVWKGRITLS